MNPFVMPATGEIWRFVGQELARHGIPPKLWLGPHMLNRFAASEFADCLVIDYKKLHSDVPRSAVRVTAPAEYLRSREFMQLKLQVLKLMDRQDDIRAFGKLEREALFYGMFNFLYSLIHEKKIDVLIACEAPHGPGYLIAYRICEYLGIPTYHLVGNTFVPLLHVSTAIVGPPIAAIGAPPTKRQSTLLDEILATYKDGIPSPLYMQKQADFDRDFRFSRVVVKHWVRWSIRRIRSALGRAQRETDDIVRHARFPYEKDELTFMHPFIVRRLRRALRDEYATLASTIDWVAAQPPRFVYFPLPYEPERTSNPDGGDFFEAMDALVALRHFVPNDVAIFVKEHPSQYSTKLKGYQGRSPLHYRAIAQLPNVKLVDLSVPSAKLVENSEFVACITGTAALEAALVGRRGVVFGSPWFYQLPGVHHFDTLSDFESLVASPVASISEITAAAHQVIETTAIPAVTSGSQERYFRSKFGADWAAVNWAEDAAVSIVKTIRGNLTETKR